MAIESTWDKCRNQTTAPLSQIQMDQTSFHKRHQSSSISTCTHQNIPPTLFPPSLSSTEGYIICSAASSFTAQVWLGH